MKHLAIPIAAVAVLALATISIVRTQPRPVTNPPPAEPPRSDFAERVAAIGLVEARSENISVSSHLPGIVDRVFVTVGQDVKRGEPLVKLDTRALEASRTERHSDIAARQAAVTSARSRAATARATLADAERHLKFAESVTDTRSISGEEIARRRGAVEIAAAAVQSADAEVAVAQAGVSVATAALEAVETNLALSVVTAPIDGRILQLRIRPGEFVPAGAGPTWLVLGDISALHLRVDIDEHEAWQVQPGARAVAHVRGNARLRSPASFVRFEPLVIPKQSLTGASTERVDTRVLQAIYRLEDPSLRLLVGQQMDVFIDASGAGRAAPTP